MGNIECLEVFGYSFPDRSRGSYVSHESFPERLNDSHVGNGFVNRSLSLTNCCPQLFAGLDQRGDRLIEFLNRAGDCGYMSFVFASKQTLQLLHVVPNDMRSEEHTSELQSPMYL